MALRIPRGMKLVNWLLGSWTVLIMIFLYVPIIVLIAYSFNDSRYVAWKGFTLKWYSEVFEDDRLMRALSNSLIVATITTLFAVLLGTIGAWLLYRYMFPAIRTINTLVFIPMIIPEVIMGVSLRFFFDQLAFPRGYATIIISHVTFCFPFVMVAVQARLAGIDPSLEEAAMDLGCTPTQAFRKVIVPYLMPAIISGALMAFTLSLDELIVTDFVYSAGTKTLPIEMYGRIKRTTPALNAISAIFVVVTAIAVVGSEILRKRNA